VKFVKKKKWNKESRESNIPCHIFVPSSDI